MKFLRTAAPPTVFHITHWKAGSQWILKILQELQPERIVLPKVGERQFFIDKLIDGGVYPTTYVTQEQFLLRDPPRNSRTLIVLRDLRDTLVSAYFSMRYSHAVMSDALGDFRAILNQLNKEDGLILLAEKWLPACALIQTSWLKSNGNIIWYEDLLKNDVEILGTALLKDCKIGVAKDLVQRAIIANRFENISDGRERGEENIYNHERKGVAGDWKNHFTSRVSERFEELYGNLLKTNRSKKETKTTTSMHSGGQSTLSDAEILDAYNRLAPLYTNIPSYVIWLSWEYAAYRKISAYGHTLDYGCSDGRLSSLILEGADLITGAAPDVATADIAKLYGPYDHVFTYDELDFSLEDVEFDCIFVRIALTQALDLKKLLKYLRGKLKANGRLICSVLTDKFNQEIGVSKILSLSGFQEDSRVAGDQYRACHDIRNVKTLEQWRVEFESAGFSVDVEIPVIPELTLHLFSLIDSLWHTPRGTQGKIGELVAARLSSNPSFIEGFRSILAGVLKIDSDAQGHAGAVMLLSRAS